MKNLEQLVANDKLFTSGFFDQNLIDDKLIEVNQFLLKNLNNKSPYQNFKAYLNHWSRTIEYQYICLNIAKFIIDKKKKHQDKIFQILDNASGDPQRSFFLADYGMNIQGTDLVDHSKEWEEFDAYASGSLSFKVADSMNLPFQNETFDISFCISAIEHMPDPVKAIDEMIRVTKKNGLILFTMDVANCKFDTSDFYVNNKNFKTLQNLLNNKCSYFAPPNFTVPSNNINWEQNRFGTCPDKRNFLRKFVSKQYKNLFKKVNPNFYIFGGSWIKN
tara:strand:- start:344 stop:1168 length:825 start_codon:yes stop_codon:yes gene_type:complete